MGSFSDLGITVVSLFDTMVEGRNVDHREGMNLCSSTLWTLLGRGYSAMHNSNWQRFGTTRSRLGYHQLVDILGQSLSRVWAKKQQGMEVSVPQFTM